MTSTPATPDLASILATLSALAPPAPGQNVGNPQDVSGVQNARDVRDHASMYQQQAPATTQSFYGSNAGAHMPSGVKRDGPKAETKVIDPATIIEWPAGLRCVMKIAAQNESIVKEIKKMIQVQHEHEQQWWDSRNALIAKQSERVAGQKKLDEVLRAVGGTPHGTPIHTASSDAAELRAFDTKIWRAQGQMVAEFQTRLKRLGVPFFGTREELVWSGDGEVPGGCVAKEELEKLQKRMVGILEDLCAD